MPRLGAIAVLWALVRASAEVTSGLDGVDQSAVGAKVADPNPEAIPSVDELGRIVRCPFPELLRMASTSPDRVIFSASVDESCGTIISPFAHGDVGFAESVKFGCAFANHHWLRSSTNTKPRPVRMPAARVRRG